MGFTSSLARTRNGTVYEHDRTLTLETRIWAQRCIAIEGTFWDDSVKIADGLSHAILDSGFSSEIVYVLPFLGSNLRSAVVPLRDSLGVGAASNVNTSGTQFVAADFSQPTGLKGGSFKKLDTLIKPNQLGASNSGGIGVWTLALDYSGSTTELGGSIDNADTNRFVVDSRSSRRFVCWGSTANLADPFTASSTGWIYGQRASATSRQIFDDTGLLASNTTSDSASGAGDKNIFVLSTPYSTPAYNLSRIGCFILTTGQLNSTQVGTLRDIIRDRLMKPTRRI